NPSALCTFPHIGVAPRHHFALLKNIASVPQRTVRQSIRRSISSPARSRWIRKREIHMRSIRRGPRKSISQRESGDGLDELRMAYYAGLQRERVHLAALSAALARAEENPVWIFQDLKFRAHKIRSGAAIFEIAEVG